MNLVPIWASPSPGDFVPHLDLMLWTLSWPHLELVTLMLSARHPYLVILVLTWASHGPSECNPSGPHLDLDFWSLPGHHRNMVTLHCLQVGLTWTW